MLEKAFGTFYNCSLLLDFFLKNNDILHSVEELQLILAASFTDLFGVVIGVTLHYGRKQSSRSLFKTCSDHTNKRIDSDFNARKFDEMFGATVNSFFSSGDRFVDTIWATKLQDLVKPGGQSLLSAKRTVLMTP